MSLTGLELLPLGLRDALVLVLDAGLRQQQPRELGPALHVEVDQLHRFLEEVGRFLKDELGGRNRSVERRQNWRVAIRLASASRFMPRSLKGLTSLRLS